VEAADTSRTGEGAAAVSGYGIERRIQAAMLVGATRGRDVESVGPFTATFARGSDHPALSYAIPDERAEPLPGFDVAARPAVSSCSHENARADSPRAQASARRRRPAPPR
jgi:hypothetical protein